MDISFTLIMFLIPLRSRTRCWPWLERKEHPIFTLEDINFVPCIMMMRFEDRNFLSWLSFAPGENKYLCSHWYNSIRWGSRGEEGKIILLLMTHFLLWETTAAVIFFMPVQYRSRQLHLSWTNNRIYTMWTGIKNDLTYGLNSTSKYLSSAPRKNISATERSLTGSYNYVPYI